MVAHNFSFVIMRVRDDPKPPGDRGEIPISDSSIGGLIPVVKSSFYLMRKN